ncbi:MAG: hypothetical protein ACI8O8_000754 [Oleiphilaceae bacterium]|jgi:hypothetical protein
MITLISEIPEKIKKNSQDKKNISPILNLDFLPKNKALMHGS